MLILTRKTDEEIIINSDIRIKILSSSDNQVKLGISAPPDVKILRSEVYDKIKEKTIEASEKSKHLKLNIDKLKINKLAETQNEI